MDVWITSVIGSGNLVPFCIMLVAVEYQPVLKYVCPQLRHTSLPTSFIRVAVKLRIVCLFFSGRGRLIQSEDTSLGSRVHSVLLSRCPAKTPSPTLIIVYQDQSLSPSLPPSAPPVLPPSGRDQRWCGNYICRLLVRRRRLHMSPRRERN